MNLDRKIPPPIVALVTAGLMYVLSSIGPTLGLPSTIKLTIVVSLVVAALAVDISAILLFRKNQTTVNPLQKGQAKHLVVEGVYQFTRNPMYLGMVLFLLAWFAYLNTLLPALGIIVFVSYITRFQVIPEERALKEAFGEDFVSYMSRVRRWL